MKQEYNVYIRYGKNEHNCPMLTLSDNCNISNTSFSIYENNIVIDIRVVVRDVL